MSMLSKFLETLTEKVTDFDVNETAINLFADYLKKNDVKITIGKVILYFGLKSIEIKKD